MREADPPGAMPSGWATRPERGSAALVRFMIWLMRHFGWWPAHLLLVPITLYFTLHARGARAVSYQTLGRALGRRAGLLDVYRQFFTFAACIVDRVFLLTGRLRGFDIRLVGLHHLTDALRARDGQMRGCLLFGSHLGSFEILRALAARDCPMPIKALMHRVDGPLTREIERLNPAVGRDIIDIGGIDAMLRVRDCLARGEIVGVLADRAPDARKRLAAPFLRARAHFPTGPMILAAASGVPVVLCFGVRVGRRCYEVHFEPFAAPLILPEHGRRAALQHWVGRYAARLEAKLRAYPYNWFNLYDFWASARDAEAAEDATNVADPPSGVAGDAVGGDLPGYASAMPGERGGPGFSRRHAVAHAWRDRAPARHVP